MVHWLTRPAYTLVTQVRTPKRRQSNQRKVMLKCGHIRDHEQTTDLQKYEQKFEIKPQTKCALQLQDD